MLFRSTSGSFGDVGGLGSYGPTGNMEAMLPPAIGVSNENEYYLGTSQYSELIATPATSQLVFLVNPTVSSPGAYSWPQSLNSFQAMNMGLSLDYYAVPIINQVYGGGPGVFGFIGNTANSNSAELYAWVRASSSNPWIGSSQSATQAQRVSSSSVAADRLHLQSYGY